MGYWTSAIMKWTDTHEIALALVDRHTDVNPQRIGFTDLHRWVTQLPEFQDDPQRHLRCHEPDNPSPVSISLPSLAPRRRPIRRRIAARGRNCSNQLFDRVGALLARHLLFLYPWR